MAQLTLRQAAEAVGVARQSIYRYVQSGRLSATTDHRGQKVVDTSELLRVFGRLKELGRQDSSRLSRSVSSDTRAESHLSPPVTADTGVLIENARLKAELEAARVQLAEAKERERQERERADRLMQVVERQMLLLEHKPSGVAGRPPAPLTSPEPGHDASASAPTPSLAPKPKPTLDPALVSGALAAMRARGKRH